MIPTGTEDDPAILFSYTVGLARKGLPELIVFGLSQEVSLSILNAAAKRLEAQDLPLDVKLDELANLPLVAKAVPPKNGDHFLNVANNRENRLLPAIQIVWPDRSGVFPWDACFDQDMKSHQILLFADASAEPSVPPPVPRLQ